MFQKTEKLPSSGYKLFDLGSHWEIHSARGIFKGALKQVCTYAVVKLGFSVNELEIAVLEMEKAFHNGAEFGVLKRFMFTFEKGKLDQKTQLH